MSVRSVIDTHLHADHLSTARALAATTGAEFVLHERAVPEYAFHRVAYGDELVVGNVSISLMHLPGHTPEHLGLLVTDRTRGDRALAGPDRAHAHGRRHGAGTRRSHRAGILENRSDK